MNRDNSLLLTMVLLISWTLLTCSAMGKDPIKNNQIRVSDFPAKATIEGHLGKPLGTVCTITGQWHKPLPSESKQDSLSFVIKEINGIAVTKPIDFDEGFIEPASSRSVIPAPKNGDVWQLRAFETGGIVGFPKEVWKELGEVVQEKYGYRFLTRVVYLSGKRLRSASSEVADKSGKGSERKEAPAIEPPRYKK